MGRRADSYSKLKEGGEMETLKMVLKDRETFQQLEGSEHGLIAVVWGTPRVEKEADGKQWAIIANKVGCVAFFHNIDEIEREQ